MIEKSSDIRRAVRRGRPTASAAAIFCAAARGLTLGLSGAAAIGGSLLPEEAFAAGLVNIEVDAGQNENPFRWNADAMKSKFGADIKMIGLPFVGQYEKLVSELTARSAAYDLLVFPPYFLGDFVALGFLQGTRPILQAARSPDRRRLHTGLSRSGHQARRQDLCADVRRRHASGGVSQGSLR